MHLKLAKVPESAVFVCPNEAYISLRNCLNPFPSTWHRNIYYFSSHEGGQGTGISSGGWYLGPISFGYADKLKRVCMHVHNGRDVSRVGVCVWSRRLNLGHGEREMRGLLFQLIVFGGGASVL